MKKFYTRLMASAAALVMATTAMVGAASASEADVVHVRVNGYTVNFPDQKPFIDENSRTLIPVRFVAEKLGADVSWDGEAAIMKKDGRTVSVPIGSKEMQVTDGDGAVRTVTMDTEAALVNSRTMVPIRYVAEELGAWVGYSNTYGTVQIMNDQLQPDELDYIHALNLGSFWTANDSKSAEMRSGSTFEDLAELAFNDHGSVHYVVENPGDNTKYDSNTSKDEEMANLFARYARYGIGMRFTSHELGVTATFRTDAGGVCANPSAWYGSPILVFGYLTLTADPDADVQMYRNQHDEINLSGLNAGGSVTFLLETNWGTDINYPYPSGLGIHDCTNGGHNFWG